MSRWRPLALLLAGALGACTPGPAATPSSIDPSGSNAGVECLRYSFAADAPRIEAVAASFSTRPFPLPADRARLAAQGLQGAIIRTADLEQVRKRLGTLTEVYRLPIGQSPAWVQLVRRDLGPGERLAASTGFTPRTTDENVLRISLRAWLVPDTVSGCVQVEVIAHVAGPASPMTVAPGDPPMGTPLVPTRVACRLQEGETLLLLPCPPVPTGKGPATAADLPPTAGMLLLGEPTSAIPEGLGKGHSTALVISAHVPAAMRPAPAAVDSEAPIADTTGDRPAP
jgi:hypothetical protein